jgi:peroxiredoxin
MAATLSTMLSLGTKAPSFRLKDTAGKWVTLEDARSAPALLVMFICNHCPYVKHIRSGLSEMARDFQARSVAVIGISSNDIKSHPEDSPQKMAQEVIEAGYAFPYLFDEDQSVAKAFRAACTPDFYLYDGEHRLVYRGQMDSSRPGNGLPVTGADLRAAVDAVLSGKRVSERQTPSIGCNIKWTPGNEPDYFSR